MIQKSHNRMTDILGTALLDYFHGNYTEDIINETNISEEDVLPLPYFFRKYSEMPTLEKAALKLCKGKVLDVGCGAGCHTLYLENKGMQITAIDSSEGAIEVCNLQGIKDARQLNLLELRNEKFDTILLLMNGAGIFQKLEYVSIYLQHLKSLLTPGGQILIDSSDLQYMYDRGEEGGIWIPSDRYYGELEYVIKYKGEVSEAFDWLYIDEDIFESACLNEGFTFKIKTRGENFDYLARLSIL
jgi:SAM-dependent methyltransferase